MMLSGFLLAYHFQLRAEREPWRQPATWGRFWIRRFLRILPVYYIALVVCFTFQKQFWDWQQVIVQAFPDAATRPERFTDGSWQNILAHVTLVFGMIPQYSYETPLPDWSLGAEAQFYAVFPFLMLLSARRGMPLMAAICVAGWLCLRAAYSEFFAYFPMPTLLPMKFYMFLCGMLLADGRARGKMAEGLILSLVFAGIYAYREGMVFSYARPFFIAGLFYLLNDGSLPCPAAAERWLARGRRVLGGHGGRWLGHMSYSVFLAHELVLLVAAGWLAQMGWYRALPGEMRFCLCLSLVLPVLYGMAWVSYRYVEEPGVHFSKRLCNRWLKAAP